MVEFQNAKDARQKKYLVQFKIYMLSISNYFYILYWIKFLSLHDKLQWTYCSLNHSSYRWHTMMVIKKFMKELRNFSGDWFSIYESDIHIWYLPFNWKRNSKERLFSPYACNLTKFGNHKSAPINNL